MKDKNTTIFRSVMITALFCMALFGIALAAISDVYESDVDGLQSQVDELKGEETSADAESSDSATISDGTVEGAKAFCEAEAKGGQDTVDLVSWRYLENDENSRFVYCGIGSKELGISSYHLGKYVEKEWKLIERTMLEDDCINSITLEKNDIPRGSFGMQICEPDLENSE